MDNTTALVALISTSGTVLVAAIGAVGTLFGERWREARLSAAQAAAAAEDRRYEALKAFSDALLASTQMSRWEDRLEANRARMAFTSTLRPGEGDVARFSRELVDEVADSRGETALVFARSGSDELFAWLRGDRALKDLGSYDGL